MTTLLRGCAWFLGLLLLWSFLRSSIKPEFLRIAVLANAVYIYVLVWLLRSAGRTHTRTELRPSRACTTTGCTGTMYLHDPIEEPPPPTHLEFPRCATWVCAIDPSHVELSPLIQ